MAHPMRHRRGKILVGAHSTQVEGLMRFLSSIEPWPEISQIRLGAIKPRRRIGRTNKKHAVTTTVDGSGVRSQSVDAKQPRKRARGGGGFSFQVTRYARLGDRISALKCDAAYGRTTQEVYLVATNNDYAPLKQRLQKAGLCGEW